jgi:ABC-type transport system involved in cytochrome c biogenesis permease component
MEVSVVSWISLAMAIVLALERIMKRVKHCKSGCCELDMKEATSPKNVALDKV